MKKGQAKLLRQARSEMKIHFHFVRAKTEQKSSVLLLAKIFSGK